jgi:sulfide dehydrogenase [flavocytochrome c] flavoprotein subunit
MNHANSSSRRQFLKLIGAAALTTAGFSNYVRAAANGGKHVVVIGGGVGGATFAKYMRLYAPDVAVTVIEKNKEYLRPYGSSEVIVDHASMKDITVSYDQLQQKYGVKFIFDTATDVDFDKQLVKTAGGQSVSYDRLIVSPGISFDFTSIEGLNQQVSDTVMPHAWIPGPQLELLTKQVKALPQGGTVLVCPPPNPYRCPPGPYERAGLITQYLKEHNPTAKVIVLDPKSGFTTDVTMLQAWNRLYQFNIPDDFKGYTVESLLAAGFTEVEAKEQLDGFKPVKHEKPGQLSWVMGSQGGRVLRVDATTKTVYTEGGEYKADVINLIPPMKAGKIAFDWGLVDKTGWCPVNRVTFESSLRKNVHVIGDSCIADAMPKSGYASNSQAKVVALQVKALLAGKEPQEPIFQNTCYALAGNKDYGQFVSDVFRVKDGVIVRVNNPRYLPLNLKDDDLRYALSGFYTNNWMKSFTDDCFA